MISVRMSGRLLDLDHHWLDVTCPRCRLQTPASLRQVRLGDIIICRGCKSNIRLIDHLGEYQRARRRLNEALQDIVNAFRR